MNKSPEHADDFDPSKFYPFNRVFPKQEQHLNSIPKQDLQKLIQLFDSLKQEGPGNNLMNSGSFEQLHQLLYDRKIIFNFQWMEWMEGWKNIKNTNFDYSGVSLLQVSMYLTAIFRADRFTEGTIEQNFNNGTLDKLFNRLRTYATPLA